MAKSIYEIARLNEVCRKTTLCANTIRDLIAENKFPKPCRLSKRAIGWKIDEVNMYLDGKWVYKEEKDEVND